MDPVSLCITGASLAVKIKQYVDELEDVDSKTQDLIDLVNDMNDTVVELQRLRDEDDEGDDNDHDDDHNNAFTRAFVDKKMARAREAMLGMSQLIEPVRVDRSVRSDGRSSLATRAVFAVCALPKLAEVSRKLELANDGLTQALAVQYAAARKAVRPPRLVAAVASPPPYDVDEYLGRARRSRATGNRPMQIDKPYGGQAQLQALSTIMVEPISEQQQNTRAESPDDRGDLAAMDDQWDRGGEQIPRALFGKARERAWLAQYVVDHRA